MAALVGIPAPSYNSSSLTSRLFTSAVPPFVDLATAKNDTLGGGTGVFGDGVGSLCLGLVLVPPMAYGLSWWTVF
jgi:hypothetical protein